MFCASAVQRTNIFTLLIWFLFFSSPSRKNQRNPRDSCFDLNVFFSCVFRTNYPREIKFLWTTGFHHFFISLFFRYHWVQCWFWFSFVTVISRYFVPFYMFSSLWTFICRVARHQRRPENFSFSSSLQTYLIHRSSSVINLKHFEFLSRRWNGIRNEIGF